MKATRILETFIWIAAVGSRPARSSRHRTDRVDGSPVAPALGDGLIRTGPPTDHGEPAIGEQVATWPYQKTS